MTTAKKLQWGDVRFQLTGPAVRNDVNTIKSHRKMLADNPEVLSLYDSLTALVKKIKNG
jgi:hypothetical protein